jgi:UDP-N-acetylmuramoylalanine--D-glutamate ligase
MHTLPQSLQGTPVLVLGLGLSGLAMARWCARAGAAVRVWDSRAAPPQADALRQALPGVVVESGPLRGEASGAALDAALDAALGTASGTALGDARLVLKSPGLAPHDPQIAALLAAARRAGVPVQGELDLFARALADLKAQCGYAPQVLAITGTNGKTTTTAMTALLVERAGRRVAIAGNVGPTLLDTLTQALDRVVANTEADTEMDTDANPESTPAVASAPALPEVWVLELSSFQLDAVEGFNPDAAALLNLTEDHLDWHGSLDAYVAAKSRVFGPDTVMVANRDDTRVMALASALLPPTVMPTKADKAAARAAAKALATAARPADADTGAAAADIEVPTAPSARNGRRLLTFGLDLPHTPGDFGLVTEHGMAWLVRALPPEDYGRPRRGQATEKPGAACAELPLQRLMPADALRVRGRHNSANALAALALATAIGCTLAPMLHGLREYRGEPHRVEPIGRIGEVEAFDDSKGTNVGATVAALLGLGADRAPGRLVVILGGDGKGQDFAPLAAPVAQFARAVATIGRDAERIEAALAATGVTWQRHASLEAAVAWSLAQARPGDAVLLSPACASLDMFRDYGHRAECFVTAWQALGLAQGEVVQ